MDKVNSHEVAKQGLDIKSNYKVTATISHMGEGWAHGLTVKQW